VAFVSKCAKSHKEWRIPAPLVAACITFFLTGKNQKMTHSLPRKN
ncbi:Uncharacterized protein APZ42_010789, partial [Daphnia magna]